MREKILLTGEMNTSKTYSIIKLAMLTPNKKVVIFDPDDGTAKVIAELTEGIGQLLIPNLTIIPVTKDWKVMKDAYDLVKPTLEEGDWLSFDMLGRFWDNSQDYYGTQVFGQTVLERIMNLRKQAQKVQFEGFDGLQDWTLIKGIHNELIDDAITNSIFNVMCTTSIKDYLPMEKVPKTGVAGIYAAEFGVKPEGEKHNIYRFDTQCFMYRKPNNSYWFRMVRDRGRSVDVKQEFEITNSSFWEVYAPMRGIQIGGETS
jgi:hypothetical protein